MRDRERWASVFDASRGVSLTWILTVTLLAGAIYPVAVAYEYNNLGSLNGDWIHHLFLRKEVALQMAPAGPRTLTIGGSGCLFSIDAEVLERELGQPVVNLCSHAGVGLEYMLARARRHARSGDTVLLLPEFRVLANPDPRQTKIEWEYFTTWDRRHYLEHGVMGAYQLLYAIPFPDLWKSRERAKAYDDKLHQIYDVTLMDGRGDLHESLGKAPVLAGEVAAHAAPPAPLALNLLSEFSGWARKNGVRVLAGYPPLAVDKADYPKMTDYLAKLPGMWNGLGVETVGSPEDVLWPSAGFMDTRQHAGPGVAYAHTVRLGRELKGASAAKEWLVVPPHPAQVQLPLPYRAGAEVRVYFGDDQELRVFLHGGGKAYAATSALGHLLRDKGFGVGNVEESADTPETVFAANRGRIVAICARGAAPALPGLPAVTAGLWREGRWELGPAVNREFDLPLATGEMIRYRFALQASATACAMGFQRRDRSPAAAAVVRMLVLDPAQGILRGIYNFDATLRSERSWVGEISAP